MLVAPVALVELELMGQDEAPVDAAVGAVVLAQLWAEELLAEEGEVVALAEPSPWTQRKTVMRARPLCRLPLTRPILSRHEDSCPEPMKTSVATTFHVHCCALRVKILGLSASLASVTPATPKTIVSSDVCVFLYIFSISSQIRKILIILQ